MPANEPIMNQVDYAALNHHFRQAKPFQHVVIDGFFLPRFALTLASEFPKYDEPKWFTYDNALERKKTLNDWHAFPSATYRAFSLLNSPAFVDELQRLTGVPLYADPGLHGGGWHIHGQGGNLNPHLDYSLHPKLKLQRKINIIVYLSPELKQEHGGHLGLWEHDANRNLPGHLLVEVEPRFNRAVVFDTTQNSWHGMSRKLAVPDNVFRRSLAAYFLTDPPNSVDERERALFAPREDQDGDPKVSDLIKLRADPERFAQAYRRQD